jgi:RluA family pseudouridine synthase
MERIVETKIGKDGAGAGLLSWLVRRFRYADADRWAGFIASGEILVNGERREADSLLVLGDLVTFKPEGLVEPPSRVDFRVIHEDADFLILDKPAHLCCHPAGPFFRNSLWYLLKEAGHERIHFASRLDRETSGILALCKNPEAIRFWEEARRAGAIEKAYAVVVHGSFPTFLEARGALVQDTASAVRKKRKFIPSDGFASRDIPPGGEACSTSFSLIHSGDGFSLVRAVLGSGRTHQIRASLASLGYPVLGDKLYGLDEGFFLRFQAGTLSDADRERLVLDRQALHSLSLGFPARDGGRRSYRAELPPELARFCPDPELCR